MRKFIAIGVILITLLFLVGNKSENLSIEKLKLSEKQLSSLLQIAMENNRIPKSIAKDNSITWINDNFDWTEGFWPGTCWMMYEYSKKEKWKEGALASQTLFLDHKNLTNDHDLGFIFNNSYGKAYKITGNEEFKHVLIDAANSLCTRYNSKVGCIQSWDVNDNWQSLRGWTFPVIIDNMMNLELLFEVYNFTKDEKYKNIAISHANTTMKEHYKSNGSSYHVVDYDPDTGKAMKRVTAQGYSNESAWARGQAWGLYGFTMCYRFTKDKRYLEFAEKIAEFILNHQNYPADGVPFWDFDAPDIPHAKRDASSGAILASALLELCEYTDDKYFNEAYHILKSLSSHKYKAKLGENGHFVLKHSVGSIPHNSTVDVPLNYADYYYIEALIRLKDKELVSNSLSLEISN